VVVGKILKIISHPNADKLVVCQVDIGKEVIQIVTGAPNVEVGQFVPVALDGALLPGGIKIKKGKLRGELSQGMIVFCSRVGAGSEWVIWTMGLMEYWYWMENIH
jgi:phenylalanyl-tRNA synthetase beta chain